MTAEALAQAASEGSPSFKLNKSKRFIA